MKNCKKHLIVALIILLMGQFLAPKAAHSQIIEVGASVGLSYYMGDINTGYMYKGVRSDEDGSFSLGDYITPDMYAEPEPLMIIVED